MSKVGRNQPCPCGSGKKYKRCCGVNAKASGLNEIARIGSRWIHQMVNKTLEQAVIVHPSTLDSDDLLVNLNHLCAPGDAKYIGGEDLDLESQELGGESEVEINVAHLEGLNAMTETGDIRDHSMISKLLRDVTLPTSNRRDRRLFSQLKLSLSQSILEPCEVIEVLRGSGFKVKGCFSGRSFQINQPLAAQQLEPMEWIYGRIVVFGRRAYLLEGWKKVQFRNRKQLRKDVQSRLGDNEISLDWLRDQSGWLLDACHQYRVLD